MPKRRQLVVKDAYERLVENFGGSVTVDDICKVGKPRSCNRRSASFAALVVEIKSWIQRNKLASPFLGAVNTCVTWRICICYIQ